MTDVYLARDVWTNQKIVLKRIEQSKDEFTRIAIEAETRGAQIQKQLHAIDPRILAIYDYGDLGNFFLSPWNIARAGDWLRFYAKTGDWIHGVRPATRLMFAANFAHCILLSQTMPDGVQQSFTAI